MDSFLNVAGHDNAKRLLLAALKSGKIAHSYLFIGVENLGKILLAKEFVKSLSCQNGTLGNPCGICPKCLAIEKETDPDVLFINSAKNRILDKNGEEKKTISIEEIRILEHHLSLFPYNSKYKIAIINEAHKFTVEAVNAFLKTLEEPKGNSIIILVADNSKFLLKTLISRTQVIRFWPLRNKIIENYLVNHDVAHEKAKNISEISFGKPGLAVSFSISEDKIQDYHRNEEIFWNFFKSNLSEKIIFLEDLSKKEENIKDVLEFWLFCVRKKILEKYLAEDPFKKALRSKENGLRNLADFVNNLVIILNLINNSNINKRLALEILALETCPVRN